MNTELPSTVESAYPDGSPLTQGLGLPARWVVVCETVLDVGLGGDVRTGGQPELGYALIINSGTFATEDEARAAHRSAGLPLGWVIMPLSQLLPDLYNQT